MQRGAAISWSGHSPFSYTNEAANWAFGVPCTATAGGLGPAVPWAAAADGTELSVCMAADVAAALGTPCSSSGCSSTMTVGNAGELHIDCGKAGDGGSATSELCRMLDRLDVTAAATLFLHRLLFERLTAGSGGNGGAGYLRSGSGAAATLVQCAFQANSGYVRPLPLLPASAPCAVAFACRAPQYPHTPGRAAAAGGAGGCVCGADPLPPKWARGISDPCSLGEASTPTSAPR